MLTDGRVPAVSERAALAAAQAGEVVLVAAEVLRDGPAGRYAFLGQLETLARGEQGTRTHLILYEQCCRLMMSLRDSSVASAGAL